MGVRLARCFRRVFGIHGGKKPAICFSINGRRRSDVLQVEANEPSFPTTAAQELCMAVLLLANDFLQRSAITQRKQCAWKRHNVMYTMGGLNTILLLHHIVLGSSPRLLEG